MNYDYVCMSVFVCGLSVANGGTSSSRHPQRTVSGQVCLLLSACIRTRMLSSEKSKSVIPFLYPPAGYHDNAYCAG